MMSARRSPSSLDEDLLVRLLQAHQERTPTAVAAGVLIAGVVGTLLWQRTGNAWLPGWIALVCSMLGLRWLGTRVYARGGRQRWSAHRWHLATVAAATAGGATWGALSGVYLHTDDALSRQIITVTLMGVTAGMAVVVHSVPGVAQGFGLACLLPLAAAMARSDGPGGLALAWLVLLYAGVVCLVGPANVGRNLRRLLVNMRDLDDALARAEDAEHMTHVGHLEWDHARKTGRLSLGAAAFFEVLPDSPPHPTQLWARVPEPERTRVVELSRAAARARQAELRFETRIQARGRLRDLQLVQRFEYGAQGRLRRTLTTFADITDLKDAQRELHQLAFHDALTGLANRSLFTQQLARTIAEAERVGQDAAVAMLDLDHFKKVNDSFGHNAGDHLLRQAADRLREAVRGGDVVARLGGDEFAVIFPAAPDDEDLALRARQIIDRLSEPFVVEDTEVFIAASIGLARYPRDSADSDGVMRCADVALFEAKARGRASHYFFDASLSERASERIALETDLRHAVEREELLLHFQPKVELTTGRTVGAEALLRWQHPGRGLVPPDRFIGIAEDTGLIVPIGNWVLRRACEAAVAWNPAPAGGWPAREDGRAVTPALKIAVNLSARQFLNQDVVATAAAILAETGCPAACIELEITESLLFDDRAGVHAALSGLHGLGFTLAIDDFGTGYSALGYLTRFPISTLKIDRSFIHSMTEDSDHLGLVRAITSMGKVLRLQLVAEGVETAPQAQLLRRMGCHQAQGWLYGKAVPWAEFERTIGLAAPRDGAPAGPLPPARLHSRSSLGG